MKGRARFLFWIGFALGLPAGGAVPLEYNRYIRPILSENCFVCHGADSASRKARLRLDSFEEATARREDDVVIIAPGHPEKSEFVRRIFDVGEDLMPPEKSHKLLTAVQKELLKRWIAEGARYQANWSFIAPVKAPPPKVKNLKWVRNPIDSFILARLEKENLQPAPEADRRTLARRLSYDLTGLPPDPAEVTAFVADRSPDAYEKLVDRWMASPHWGEHRARYWLDAARYADTHGIHFDNYREMWTYRDWVINAFNANLPFDQFTVEQLAGDLLPQATLEQKVASGFNRCNITTSEGGAIDEEYLVLYARDRTETTAQVWLGLTAGCAVCHDHKYDPLSQKEFYQLSAFFNNTTQKAMDGNVKDTPPVIVLPKLEERARWLALQEEMGVAETKVEQRRKGARPDFEAWLGRSDFSKLDKQVRPEPLLFRANLDDGGTNQLRVQVGGADQVVMLATNPAVQTGVTAASAYTISTNTSPTLADVGDFERTNAFSCATWVRLAGDSDGSLFARMSEKDAVHRGWDLFIEGGRPAVHLVHSWPDDALKVAGKKQLPKERWAHVAVTYDGSSKAAGVKIFVDGEPQVVEKEKDALKSGIRTQSPFKIGERDGGSRVDNAGLQDLRVYGRVLTPEEVQDLAGGPRLKWLASRTANQRTKEEVDGVYPFWLKSEDAAYRALVSARDKLKEEAGGIKSRGAVAHVMNERETPAEAYLLFRGQYDQRRDKLAPDTPKVFPPMPAGLPRNRLGLAQWLMRPEHPLTARVTVNRCWQELFGTGLVRTSGDFGVAGEMPSHPELLDWLAVEFRESGWDTKKLFKLLVMSATYRQSAAATPAKLARDPQNRLLAHGPRFRMDAEMVRDTALSASGLLVGKIGGPSVKPYQPDGVWEAVAMPSSDTRFYKRDRGDSLYRRSVYTFWKRAAPPASLDILNAPSRETCTVRRERTSTPLQALVTLNDPQFVEAARHLAERALKEGGAADAARIDFMAERLIARPLRPAEKKIVTSGLKDLLAHYQASPKDAEALVSVGESEADATLDKPRLAAYTLVANQLMNLDEVLNK
ncbi:MAG: DUF1553 domain-containing protein [Verrucomicrobiota bacterium]